ncbi:transcription initiation factor TAFII31 [Thamnocephalis sphaerospora]|uniref:Transcription initiation factor TAFII31 n=1 Tax=Thamnocephalis sphaerospora TaxID=78915 RepID=A0A4V1IWR4_9FUNG|nr:transcription initiation factor TAFII31 [Thamnocephalis sphaerospora]|eukprot:RKP08469.1 transcription initiation factor TAFII31 [Thamnocephalis sphaerospora]
MPKEAHVMALILNTLGVEEYDPKVLPMLMEFAHRYMTDVFQDAQLYADHAGKRDVDLDDVQLAIQGIVNNSFTGPPPREFLTELAAEKNSAPLPLIPERYGIRLPPEQYCLTGANYQIVPEPPSTEGTRPAAGSSMSATR